jgi:hypothetical protein
MPERGLDAEADSLGGVAHSTGETLFVLTFFGGSVDLSEQHVTRRFEDRRDRRFGVFLRVEGVAMELHVFCARCDVCLGLRAEVFDGLRAVPTVARRIPDSGGSAPADYERTDEEETRLTKA